MVEPTIGRTDYQEEVAMLNGVNIVQAAYRSMAGLPGVAPRPVKQAVIWSDADGDAKSRQAQPAAPVLAEAARARVVDALYRTGDTGPWIQSQVRRVASRLARLRR
jgi:hypothetical protein